MLEPNFDFHFHCGDMAINVSPICLYREAIHLQCLPPVNDDPLPNELKLPCRVCTKHFFLLRVAVP